MNVESDSNRCAIPQSTQHHIIIRSNTCEEGHPVQSSERRQCSQSLKEVQVLRFKANNGNNTGTGWMVPSFNLRDSHEVNSKPWNSMQGKTENGKTMPTHTKMSCTRTSRRHQCNLMQTHMMQSHTKKRSIHMHTQRHTKATHNNKAEDRNILAHEEDTAKASTQDVIWQNPRKVWYRGENTGQCCGCKQAVSSTAAVSMNDYREYSIYTPPQR